ncbi:MAG: PASTA domain-containing protein [Oscillospiraceae bacterium]|nr:PASTA domain-containing protein [Oscillospiraceae bacterium]
MKPPSVNLKSRMMVLFVFIFIVFAALIMRVGYWQIVKGEELKAKAVRQQTRERAVTANRGYIYDRNEKVLAKSVTVDTLACTPTQVKKDGYPEVVAQNIADILSMDYNDVYNTITKNSSYQIIKKRLSAEESKAIRELKDGSDDKRKKEEGRLNELSKVYSGIYFEEDSKRYYSYNIAPHVIGFTGYDNEGRQGIEMTFDDSLTGRAGNIRSAKAANGINMDFQYEAQTEAERGCDLVLTIDETMQHFLEKHLENAVVEDRLKEGAAGIIMNPKTGEILAMSTKPDFDLNNPYDTDIFEKYQIDIVGEDEIKPDSSQAPESDEDKKAKLRYKMWRNKAISDTYEPGSTFKIITAAIGLEENVVNLDTPFYCGGSVQIGTHNIRCHKTAGHGAENFVEGVQNSCNPVFIETGLRIGGEKFMDYFRAFGLTEKTGIELVGEARSIYHTGKLSEADIATSAFGQGFNVTPIQLISAVSAVINGGNLMKPMLVKEIRNESGVVQSYRPEIRNKVISEKTSDTMREILESVVSAPSGTGKNAYVKGYRIGGKTGTSQKGSRSEDTKRIASFIGFAPADDPQIICLVMLDEPQCDVKYGGTIAAPLVGDILEDVLDYIGVERRFTEQELKEMSLAVPELRGMSVDEARAEAQKSGLKIKVVNENEGEAVVDQLPKPGASITNGSTVIIYMKEREDDSLVVVPDVVGLSMEEAQKRLEKAGLNFEIVGAGQKNSQGAYAAKQSIEAGQKTLAATVVGVEFRHESSD